MLVKRLGQEIVRVIVITVAILTMVDSFTMLVSVGVIDALHCRDVCRRLSHWDNCK
jgi:hypothetical protein